MGTKQELRKRMIHKINKMSFAETVQKSYEIKKQLSGISEFLGSHVVSSYFSKGNEVYTHGIIEDLLRKDTFVTLPRMNGNSLHLHRTETANLEHLVRNRFGIYEPKEDAVQINILMHDSVLVPGVAFDEKGNRIGYGKGYYDKLLAEAYGVFKIGLAYEKQILTEVPVEKFDIPMDVIVTEKRIIYS